MAARTRNQSNAIRLRNGDGRRPMTDRNARITAALQLLDIHYDAFVKARHLAEQTAHPIPCDTRAWSQVLVSLLTGIPGLARKKGADLSDGSDVKAANSWLAIDFPRFNGVLKAGRVGAKDESIGALDSVPYLFFVLWDRFEREERCRVWCVRTQVDETFRAVGERWYSTPVRSANFQLHPPIDKDDNIVTNKCGNLDLPLLFCAERRTTGFTCAEFSPEVLQHGRCRIARR